MKKVILGLFFVCLSIIIAVFFSCPVNASDKDITINTIYPEGVLDYVNLTNINCFDIISKSLLASVSLLEEPNKLLTKANDDSDKEEEIS